MDEGCCGCKHTPLWFFMDFHSAYYHSACDSSRSFCVKGMKPITDHHTMVLTATRQQSPFSLLVYIIPWISFLSFPFSTSLRAREREREWMKEEQRKCLVALCLSFASHSRWLLWLSCSNWTLLQIQQMNNGSLCWMSRVALWAVASQSERNRYAISDGSHAKSHRYKELSL